MPWFASPFSTSVSSVAGYAAFFGFLKAAINIVSKNKRLIVDVLIVWLSGVCLSIGNLNYLFALRDQCGLSETWSGLVELPNDAVASKSLLFR